MISIYIASPYTIGDTAVNVKLQIDTADKIIGMGMAPFAPLMSHFQHMHHPRPYQDWMKLDFHWIEKCDILLRLGGESKGADEEVEHATKLGIPVVYNLWELAQWYHDLKEVHNF